MPIYPLRPYQLPAVEALKNWIEYRNESGYLKAAGGAGKSIMIADIAEWCFNRGERVVVLARSEKLLTQNKAKFAEKYHPHIGLYCAGLGEKTLDKAITVASIQSIANKGSELGKIDRILIDEIQNLHNDPESDTQYWNFIKSLGSPPILGYTATDFRTASGELKFGKMIHEIPFDKLVKGGWLIPPTNKAIGNPDLSKVQVLRGDYNGKQLEEIYLEPELLAKSIEALQRYTHDRHTVLIFTQSIAHGKVLQQAMADNGMVAEFVDGGMDKDKIVNPIVEEFGERRIKYLINVALFVEGTDIPAIDCICVFLSTMSKGKFEQILFRGTRLYEGKTDFLVLDLGGNFARHGGLGSAYKEKSKKEGKQENKGKICPQCESFVPPTIRECPDCGFQFPEIEASKISHEYEPDMLDTPVYNSLVRYEVDDVIYRIHIKRATGGMSLRVDYISGRDCLSEWLAYTYTPKKDDTEGDVARKTAFLHNKIKAFFRKRGYSLYDTVENYGIENLISIAENNLTAPSHITVDHSGEFARITDYEFLPKEVKALTNEETAEILDGDTWEF